MFKHLLVPLDGSELAEKALSVARQALDAEGTLTLLNVIDLPDINLMMVHDMPPMFMAHDNRSDILPAAKKNAQEYLQKVVEWLSLPPSIKLNVEVVVGSTAETIAERAQALHVDAVVMSTHGRSGLSRWMFGSVTQRVLSVMPCPVIVVPGRVAASAPASEAAAQTAP